MVEPFGIDKIPDVMHYVELLGQAVDRHLFETSQKMLTQHRKTNEDRRRFIAIFNQRYLQATDMEYDRPITPVEGKMITQTTKTIEAKGFTIDEFLQWVFEVFLEESPKFNPATIHLVCSRFVIDKFLYENRDKIKQKQEAELQKKDALDVVARARTALRSLRDMGKTQDQEKIVSLLKQLAAGGIMLEELRKEVERVEAIIRQEQAQTGGKEHGNNKTGQSGHPGNVGAHP